MTQASSDSSYDYLVKILVVGDSGVGKSCMLLQFVENAFTENFITTVGIDFRSRIVKLGGKRLKLQLWDTAGQERFKQVTQAYYRGANGIVLVYDVTELDSFLNITTWLADIRKGITSDCTSDIILVGNKNDLHKRRAVPYSYGEELAKKYGLKFFEISSKNHEAVNNVFLTIAADVKEHILDRLQEATPDRALLEPVPSSKCCFL